MKTRSFLRKVWCDTLRFYDKLQLVLNNISVCHPERSEGSPEQAEADPSSKKRSQDDSVEINKARNNDRNYIHAEPPQRIA
jgi:hypothetical protein